MEQSTLGILSLYALLGMAIAILWLRHQQVLRQRDTIADRVGSLEGDLNATSARLDLLSRGVDTVFGETPELHGLLGVHRSLETAESLLFEQAVGVSSSESCAIATHAARAVLDGQEDTVGDDVLAIPAGMAPLVERLGAMLDAGEMHAEDLELTGPEQRRLGELFHAVELTDRAAQCYRRAHELGSEDAVALRSLATIQREEGDVEALDRSLERLLAIDPDDVEVLEEQALLLSGTDMTRVVRNRRRLEALGIDLNPTTEESTIADLAGRAHETRMEVDPLSTEPTTAAGWTERAAKLMLLGEVPVALESVENALELDQSNPDAWLLHARLLAAGEGNTSEAIQSVRRAVALGEYGILLEAEILENDGRLEAARDVLQKHLETDPGDAEARGRLALTLLRAGSPEWARQVLNEASEHSWESAALHVMDGRLHLEEAEKHLDFTGDHDDMILLAALTAFDEAIERDRESGLAWLGRSRTLRYQGFRAEAEIAIVRARRLIPEHPSIPLESARLFTEMGRFDQANTMLAEAATNLHNHPSIPYVRGLIAARQGRMAEALGMFTKVLERDPDHSRARLNRCSAALLREDLTLALDDANILVEQRPDLDMARQRRAEILMNLGDWTEAEAELRRLSKRNPQHVMALVHLGTCLNAMGRAEQAEIPLNKALQIDPKHSDAWYQRGLLYLDFERLEEAFSDFKSAAAVDDRHLDARLRIAAILHDAGDQTKAIAAWRDVLDVDPEHKLARRRLEESRERLDSTAPRLETQD
tara:strand:- start:276 stop:2573 length:2298 start_codon:yes stop_codon:yes gene_type:complete